MPIDQLQANALKSRHHQRKYREAQRKIREMIMADDKKQALIDLALNVAGLDDHVLLAMDLRTLRATLHEYREQARTALSMK